VLGCALLLDLGAAPDGPRCGELAAFCVSPAYRGSGRGDALLDYVEQSARDQGMRRLALLTTRTADWRASPHRRPPRPPPTKAAGLTRARAAQVPAARLCGRGRRAPERAAAGAAALRRGPQAQRAAVCKNHLRAQ